MNEQHLTNTFDNKELSFKSFKEDAGIQYQTHSVLLHIGFKNRVGNFGFLRSRECQGWERARL